MKWQAQSRAPFCTWVCLVLLLELGALPYAVHAGEAGPRIYRLQPKAQAGLEHGKAVIVRGESTPQGHRYFIENLNMLIPVAVTLVARNPEDDIRLAISKVSWARPEREGGTGKDGSVSFRFRTQGEFQMTVSAPGEAKPYQLVAWVGDEVKPAFRPVVVKQSDFEAKQGKRIMGPRLWLIAGTLAVIAGLLAVLVLRRKRA